MAYHHNALRETRHTEKSDSLGQLPVPALWLRPRRYLVYTVDGYCDCDCGPYFTGPSYNLLSGGVGIDCLIIVCSSLQEKSKWLNVLKQQVRAVHATVPAKPQNLQVFLLLNFFYQYLLKLNQLEWYSPRWGHSVIAYAFLSFLTSPPTRTAVTDGSPHPS